MAAHKMETKSRKSLLFSSNKQRCTKTDSLILSTPNSKDFPAVRTIIQKYLPVLNKDPKLQVIMQTGCKVVPRKGKTLGNMLSPSELVENIPRTWLFLSRIFPK